MVYKPGQYCQEELANIPLKCLQNLKEEYPKYLKQDIQFEMQKKQKM